MRLTLDDIERLAMRGESLEPVEFKRSTGELRQGMESLCAFLNAGGGAVVFGVGPKGAIVGQDVTDRTLQDVANAIAKLEPETAVPMDHIPLPGTSRQLLILYGPPSESDVPFVYDGRPYHRVGTTSPQMPQSRYQQLLLERTHKRSRWEITHAPSAGIADLDASTILGTVQLARERGYLRSAGDGDAGEALRRMKLIERGGLLNAAVVLFGSDVLPHFPQCHLRMARFKGTSKIEFTDNRQVHGNAFYLLDEAMAFLQQHLSVADADATGMAQQEGPLFPTLALREAVVNALCHRDYAIVGGSVSIAIYDDRLEIWSDGKLPYGVQIEDLKREHLSRPRNELIAQIFHMRGLVEQWGRGTQYIVELCVQAGHPEPEFLEQAGAFGVRFIPSRYIPPYRVAHDLTPRHREILQILAHGERLQLREIHQAMQDPPSERSLHGEVAHLMRLSLIEAVGQTRGRMYRLRRGGSREL